MKNLILSVTDNDPNDVPGALSDEGFRINFWYEFIPQDWNPNTINWTNRPASIDSGYTDSNLTIPWILTGLSNNDYEVFVNVFSSELLNGQTVNVENDPSTSLIGNTETMKLVLLDEVGTGLPYLINAGGQVHNLSLLNRAGIDIPTITTVRVRGAPFDYINSSTMTLGQLLWSSPYNVENNFIGGQITVTYYDSVYPAFSTTITGYASDGTFSVASTKDYSACSKSWNSSIWWGYCT